MRMMMMMKMLTRTYKIQYLLFVFMNSLLLDDNNGAAAVVAAALQKLTRATSYSPTSEDISLWT